MKKIFWIMLAACPMLQGQVSLPAPILAADRVGRTRNTGVLYTIRVERDIRVKDYFDYMDKLVAENDTFSNRKIDEYLLVHANSWIIDSLRAFDYYTMMERGVFVYDQPALVILPEGTLLNMPDSATSSAINNRLASTIIDVNIPEFRLRLIQLDDTILDCMVRVGRNSIEYLAVVGREVDLRTPVGEGQIVRVARKPDYVNPKTGKKYTGTNRDDKRYTKMPLIPWLEPTTNGIRMGAMIHPTTNPETLGKAYSNGCVGTTERDAWTIYYNAPIGTKVMYRYDLELIDQQGNKTHLKDIYGLKR